MTGPSTTFGSTSSGLYSDTDSKTSEDLLDGGLSIDPEAWMKNPGASLEDMLRMKQSGSGFQEKNEDSTDDSSKESDVTIEDDDKTKICIGDTEKEVAHSKLSALISLLEQDREHSSSNRRYVKIINNRVTFNIKDQKFHKIALSSIYSKTFLLYNYVKIM